MLYSISSVEIARTVLNFLNPFLREAERAQELTRRGKRCPVLGPGSALGAGVLGEQGRAFRHR